MNAETRHFESKALTRASESVESEARLIKQEKNEIAADYGFKDIQRPIMLSKANGSAEETNKVLKTVIRKMIEDNPNT